MTRLLLVTQFPDEQAIYGEAFRAEGFDVQVADSPDDAFDSAMRTRPDVVVARVPQANVLAPDSALLRRLKQDDDTRSVPVVILTSLMQPEHRAAAVDEGCDGYLLIPALPETLIKEVRRVMGRRSSMAQRSA